MAVPRKKSRRATRDGPQDPGKAVTETIVTFIELAGIRHDVHGDIDVVFITRLSPRRPPLPTVDETKENTTHALPQTRQTNEKAMRPQVLIIQTLYDELKKLTRPLTVTKKTDKLN